MKLQFRTVHLSIIRSPFTVHSAMAYVIQVCRQVFEQEHMLLLESCLQTCMTYIIAKFTVNKLLMMDRRTSETCRVSCQNKLVKLVRLVGCIIKKFFPMQHCHMNVKNQHQAALLWAFLHHFSIFIVIMTVLFHVVNTVQPLFNK